MPSDDSTETEIAQPQDFFVTRDSDDELQPVTQDVPGVEEKIRVIPMTLGDLNEYGGAQGQLNPAELDPDDVAEIFNEHWYDVRENDDFEVTSEMVEEDMIAFGRDALIQAILRASGYDMQNAINMENLEMLEQIDDPGKLEKLAEFAEDRV
jgi:hypothetical protein